jgi:hypothetical protein
MHAFERLCCAVTGAQGDDERAPQSTESTPSNPSSIPPTLQPLSCALTVSLCRAAGGLLGTADWRCYPLWPAIGIPPLVYQRRRGSTPRWAGRGRLPPGLLLKVRSRCRPRTRRPNGPFLRFPTSHQGPILPRRVATSHGARAEAVGRGASACGCAGRVAGLRAGVAGPVLGPIWGRRARFSPASHVSPAKCNGHRVAPLWQVV